VRTKRVRKNSLGDQGTWLPVRPAVIPLSGTPSALFVETAQRAPVSPFPSGTPQEVHHLRSAELRQLPSTLLIVFHNPGSKRYHAHPNNLTEQL